MTADAIWAIVVGITALALSISLIITPDRFDRWRAMWWETDSNGDLPPKQDKEQDNA